MFDEGATALRAKPEHSSGQVRRLGAITKHGNSYVRMLLIHGARSALRAGAVTRHPDDLRSWACALAARKGHNVAAVALANKLARVGWRVWRDGRPVERRAPRYGGFDFPRAAPAITTMASGLTGAGTSR